MGWGGVGSGGLHLSRPRATEGQRASTSDFARVSSDFERSRAISSEFEWIRVGSSTFEWLSFSPLALSKPTLNPQTLNP